MTSHSLLGNQFWVSSCFIHLEAVHFSTTLLMGHLARKKTHLVVLQILDLYP